MTGMGAHSHPNGHRGEDGAAAVAALEPAAISTALSPQRLIPFSLQWAAPQQDAPATAAGEHKAAWWHDTRRVMSAHRAWLAAVPVILVNAVAFGAQLGFWRVHVTPLAEAVLVALALESIAIYLAWQAHLAQLADDSALRLRLAAYGMALIIGALNYSHFDGPGWRPTVPAVTFGMMSAISPWLWSVHSRRVSRDALKALRKIEPHAVRLGGTRWMWHPFRSVSVMSHATWTGETDPAAAIAAWQPRKARRTAADMRLDKEAGPAADIAADRPADSRMDSQVDKPPARDMDKPQARTAKRTVTGQDKARDIIRRNPGLSNAEVARRAGVSPKTVQRARAELAKT